MNSESPLLSVVMSVYNGEKYLHEAIESILNQTFVDYEFIIINDGSEDKTDCIIRKYMSIDSRIVYLTQKNIGLTKSLNIGIDLSKGKYIARMDADDLSMLNRFAEQIIWMEKGYDLCCSRTWLIDDERISPRLFYYLPKRLLLTFSNPFIHGTFMLSKKVLDEVGGYDELFKYAQDYKLLLDLFKINVKVKYIKEALYQTRNSENSIGNTHLDERRKMTSSLRWF